MHEQYFKAEPGSDVELRALFQLYLRDMAEWFDFDPATAYDAASVWASDREVYFATIDGVPAGFALIGPTSSHRVIYDVHEFFVIPEFRRARLGQRLAMHVWDLHPGEWQVRVLQANQRAAAFWRATVTNYAGGRHTEETLQIHDRAWRYFGFHSPRQS